MGTKTHPAFAAIRYVSERLDLPKTFKRDVYMHDRRAIRYQPVSRPFVWAIRDHGSHLVWMDGGMGKTSLTYVRSVQEMYPETWWYGWDGARLWPLQRDIGEVQKFAARFAPSDSHEHAAFFGPGPA